MAEESVEECADVTDIGEMLENLVEKAKDLGRSEHARDSADRQCRRLKVEVADLAQGIQTMVIDMELQAMEDDPDMPPCNEDGVAIEVPAAKPETKPPERKAKVK